MVIIAVAAAVAIPSVGAGRRQREIRTTLQHFISAVRFASSTSIFERRRVELRLWPDDGEYGIVQADNRRRDSDGEFLDEHEELHDLDDEGKEKVDRRKLPEAATFGEIEGGRRDDLDELGMISIDFFPTGSSSGGEIEIIFEHDRSRQTYLLKINPLVSSISMEVGS
jgi:type II secretory pathway pseudopilin PulG